VRRIFDQLKTDKIVFNEITIRKIIGNITFHKTDNDRSIIGIQNILLENLELWKYEFGAFENWDFRDINKRINSIPYKQLNWWNPRKRMQLLFNQINVSE